MFKTIISLLVASSAATVVSTVIPRDYSARPGSRSQRACAQLKADFPNNYVDASSGANYTSKVDFNWSTNCDLPAACFFVPTSTDMVAKGLSIVTKNGAQFAIRNGGHNPNVGFSSTSGGVLFDMSGMKSVSMSPDQTIIYAGSGYTGGGLQKVADSVGRSVVTGIDIAPGITGLTTLGGYTHFSQLHGLPTDNIVNFEVVLGNSTVVNANATHNTGLYRGLRGGGNNFGIVTRLDLRTSPVRNIWYALYLLDPKDYVKYMQAIGKIHAGMEKDPKANIEVLASPQGFQIGLWYAEHTLTPELFAPILEFLPTSEVIVPPTNGTLVEIMEAMSSVKPPMVRMIDSVVHKPSVDLYIDLFEKILEEEPTGHDTDLVLAIKPMGPHTQSVGTARAGGVPNSLNIQPISQVWTSILSQYVNDVDKDEMVRKLHLVDEWLRDYARNNGDLLLPNIFGNDAGSHQNVIKSYGKESVANMKAVSTMYDPAQVFQRLQAGGFLVSKA